MKSELGRALRCELRGVRLRETTRRRILAKAASKRPRHRKRFVRGTSPLVVAASLVLTIGMLALAVSVRIFHSTGPRNAPLTGGEGCISLETALLTDTLNEGTPAVTAAPFPSAAPISPVATEARPEEETSTAAGRLSLRASQFGDSFLLLESRYGYGLRIHDTVVSANGWSELSEEGLIFARRWLSRFASEKEMDQWQARTEDGKNGCGIVVNTTEVLPYPSLKSLAAKNDQTAVSMDLFQMQSTVDDDIYQFYDPDDPGHRVSFLIQDDPQSRNSLPAILQQAAVTFYYNGVIGCCDGTLLPTRMYDYGDGTYQVEEDKLGVGANSIVVSVPVENYAPEPVVLGSDFFWEGIDLEFNVAAVQLPNRAVILIVEGVVPIYSDFISAVAPSGAPMRLDILDGVDLLTGITGWYLPDGLNDEDMLELTVDLEGEELSMVCTIEKLELRPVQEAVSALLPENESN